MRTEWVLYAWVAYLASAGLAELLYGRTKPYGSMAGMIAVALFFIGYYIIRFRNDKKLQEIEAEIDWV